ncbi:MAG TPA: HlyD family efflux transporter periplasmic adaptor subunit [Tissierellales bacterium]|nr:HlyD family efflux transporter periplasmic adaptor subunit [Tissierellales bacterium]
MLRGGRNSKRQKKRKYRMIFIVFIICYLVFRSVPNFIASTLKTTLAERGTLDEKVEGEGIIIKKEKVYKADGEGKISFDKGQGDRIGVGTKVGQLSLIGDKSTLTSEMDDINKKIESLESLSGNKNLTEEDKEKNQLNIDSIVNQLQSKIFEGDYNRANLLKDELDLYSEKQRILEGDNTLASQSLEELKKRKEQLQKEISDNAIYYYSEESGIISFEIDGLEETFSADNILNYSSRDFKNIDQNIKKTESNTNLKIGEPVYKVIDNLEWYIMVKVNDENKIDELEKGNNIYITIDDMEEKIEGEVIKVEKNKNDSVVIVKCSNYLHNYYNKRYVKADLIKKSHEGIKLPAKAITNKDGIDGVYVKDMSGIIRFRPIKLLGKNEEYAVVAEGDKNHMIKLEGMDKYKMTITLHDEILSNTTRIKEGQIVN